MQLACSICKKSFTWIRPSGRHGSNPPKICGEPGKNGKWIPTLACKKARQAKLYANWVKNNPEKAKTNQKKQYKKRKHNQKLQSYVSKNTPKSKQWKCQRCGRWSSNRINCPDCRTFLSDNCSDQYPDFIFMDGDTDLSDVADARAACL